MNRKLQLAALVSALLGTGMCLLAQQAPQASAVRDVGIDQQLGSQLSLDAEFRDESGETVRLARYFHGKPVLLAPVYFSCPSLCPMTLNSLTQSLRLLQFDAGRDFEVVALSFDSNETPEIAGKAKAHYVSDYHRTGADAGFHFLTGTDDSIQEITDAIGFHYTWDDQSRQWAHATGVMIVTPDGRISQYLYGLEYSARDLRLALVEASAGKLGSIVDKVLLYCYRYDPAVGKYGVTVIRAVRACGILTAFLLFGFMFTRFRRDARAGRL